jgi:hypothetical protein
MSGVRSQPCSACPYRRDVPSGVWAHEEYEKLRPYDALTGDQPLGVFACHATPESLCHGWVVCHTNRGHEHDLLALRIRGADYDLIPEETVPLFDSGNDAADHGQTDITDPSPEAIATADRLMRKYERLQR